jgi:LysM repeat protein
MGLLDSVNSARDTLRNPFSSTLDSGGSDNDFPDGFIITEMLNEEKKGDTLSFVGNMMPKIPFTFGGGQRIKKEFYAGSSEPVLQVLGGEEDDITINGTLKDKKLDGSLEGASHNVQLLINEIRKRGNVVKIELGEFFKFAIISKATFEMNRLSFINYSITFIIIGDKYPLNGRFLEDTEEVPVNINKDLIEEAALFQEDALDPPESVPFSIADKINGFTSDIAGAVADVTNFVDQIVTTVNDIQKSITRVKGMIKNVQNKLKSYKKFIGAIKPFNDVQALTGRYESAKFYSLQMTNSSNMTRTLERLKLQLSKFSDKAPLGRHFVIQGDTLQKISVKFYGSPDNWKKIYDYNRLTNTRLVNGVILEVPRV